MFQGFQLRSNANCQLFSICFLCLFICLFIQFLLTHSLTYLFTNLLTYIVCSENCKKKLSRRTMKHWASFYTVAWLDPQSLTEMTLVADITRHLVHGLAEFIVVWPTTSCFADWSRCRHVTLIVIEWSTRHGWPRVIIMIHGHVTFTICKHRNKSELT